MTLGKQGSDKCSPNQLHFYSFIYLFILRILILKKINANSFQSTSFNVFELERTCKGGCINVWVYPTSGHYGSANENGGNTNSKLTQSKKWTGKEEDSERPVEVELTILSVFKAWVVIPPKSHSTIIRTQISADYAAVLLPWSDVVGDTLAVAPSPSVFGMCRPPLEENGRNDSHGQHELTPPQGETASLERPLCKPCGFRGRSLPRAKYECTVAALVMGVESVGAVAVAADEAADTSVTVKATISLFLFFKKKKLVKKVLWEMTCFHTCWWRCGCYQYRQGCIYRETFGFGQQGVHKI